MTQLVIIKKAPPLHQSTIKVLACPRSYVAIEIQGLKPPPSKPSDRGTEIHHVAGVYTDHCVNEQIPSDWAEFDKIARSVGAEAAEILEGVRDNYVVAFEHVAGTELTFYLDANFQPSSEEDAAYSGTIDVALINRTMGGIIDWKSHLRPFDAPDEQSDLYSLAWMQLNPQLQTLMFRFRFVRYVNCERRAEYSRDDLPRIMRAMSHHRAKQLAIHANPDEAEAIPSKQCLYCPLLKNGCPIDPAVNPWASPTMYDRLKRAVYLAYAQQENNEVLKEAYEAAGAPLEYVDGKGDTYLFGKKSTESFEYPLLVTLQNLLRYRDSTPNDIAWMDNLVVGATKLKSYLKAKKRAILDLELKQVARPVTRVKTGLHKADDDPDDNEYRGE
jgi:hypothetical protein